jgi:hypothetical protein
LAYDSMMILTTASDSRHAKVVTPPGETLKQYLEDDAIAAAIREFELRDGNLSDDE